MAVFKTPQLPDDLDPGTLTDGMVPVYDEASARWVPGVPDSGTSGSGSFVIVTENATIPPGTEQGQLVAYRNSAVSSVTVSGTALASGEWGVWAWLGSSWSLLKTGSASGGIGIPTGPDTTNPIPGTLSSSVITETGFTVTVTGASDDRALSTGPYSFSINGGAWTAWQASASYVATGLTASTTYSVKHRVRDAADNVAEGVPINVSTPAPTESWTWVDSFDDVAANVTIHNRPLTGGVGTWPAVAATRAVSGFPAGTQDVWGLRGTGTGAVKAESAVARAAISLDAAVTPMRARLRFDAPATAVTGDLVRLAVSARSNYSGGTADHEYRGVWLSYIMGTGLVFQYANYTVMTTVATHTAAGVGALSGLLTLEYDGTTAKAWFDDTLIGTQAITGLDGTNLAFALQGDKITVDHFWARTL